MKPRILLYAHDGSGFGHLARISRLAMMLQKNFTCLVITGTKEVAWLLSSNCEYVKLPSWASMYRSKLNQDDELWYELSKEKIVNFRSMIIESIFNSFKPDAVIIDHLPHGLRNELFSSLKMSSAKKYLLLRGVFDTCDKELREKLSSPEVARLYDRFIIAADKRVIEGLMDFPLCHEAIIKSAWVGYMASINEEVDKVEINNIYSNYKAWVVCSAGSGLRGEPLFTKCIEEAKNYPTVFFDIVLGTRSKINYSESDFLLSNIRISKIRQDLPKIHKMADIVITSGGYNSMLEAISGKSEIIVSPVNKGFYDEQIRHAMQLQKFYPLMLANDVTEIPYLLKNVLTKSQKKRYLNTDLNLNGIKITCDLICKDFNINTL